MRSSGISLLSIFWILIQFIAIESFAADSDIFGAQRLPTLANSGGSDVETVDLNGDGHSDVFVVENLAGGFSVHLGDGEGRFDLAFSINNVTGSQSGELADLNQDGVLDVIIQESIFENKFSIFLGNGDGTFTFDSDPTLGINSVDEFEVADLTGDGLPDLAATSFDNSGNGLLNILPGLPSPSGNNFFDTATTLTISGAASNELAIEDTNQDGDLDIIVASQFPDNSVIVFENDGAGVFTRFAQVSIPAGGIAPQAATVADINGDGIVDIVYSARVTSPSSMGIVGVLAGSASGQFSNPVITVLGATGVVDLVTADFNNDGNIDIAGANFLNDSLIWLAGNGDFGFAPHVYGGSGSAPLALSVVDVNEDGIDDVIAVNIGSDDFTVHTGTGDDSFFTSPRLSRIGADVRQVEVGDLNGDNQVDLLSANFGSGSISILSNLVNGQFTSRVEITTNLISPSGAVIIDLDGDNHNDIVVSDSDTDKVQVFTNDGLGGFLAPVGFNVCDRPIRIAVDDVNNDGHEDVLTACFTSNNLSLLLGDGTSGFSPALTLPGVTEPQDLVLGDLNDDGAVDIILADSTQGNSGVRVLFGAGDGTFGLPTLLVSGSVVASVAVGDVNQDNVLDLAIGNLGQGPLIAIGNGDGTFATPFQIAGPISPLAVALNDINADGFDDVLAIEASSGNRNKGATVTLSNGDGTFQDDLLFAVASGVDAPFAEPGILRTITLADVNSDDREDLLVGIAAAEFEGAVSVDLNKFLPVGQIDTDGDGVVDSIDNCLLLANEDQRDTDGDSFGNRCDADLNNDNFVNFLDLGLMSDVFFTNDENADLNGDGFVNFLDFSILTELFFLPPGPGAKAQW